MKVLTVFVPGVPVPGGSKRGFPIRRAGGGVGVAMSDASGQRVKDWRAKVALACGGAMVGPPRTAPLRVSFLFTMPRPKAHYRTGKHAGELRPDAPDRHVKAPDVTKLIRSTEDAMTGIVWADDKQVWEQSAMKVYGDRPGVLVSVWEAE